jgi:hypothetical protein
MCWTERGENLLLQFRTKAMKFPLRDTFEGWYPENKGDSLVIFLRCVLLSRLPFLCEFHWKYLV